MGSVSTLNVCHLASGDLWAGAEVQVATLLVALTKYDHLRLSAIFYNSGILADRVRQAGIPVWVIEESRHNALALTHKTARILRQERIDLLHTHRYKENVLGGIAAKLSGVRHLICTVHGIGEPFMGYQNVKASLYGALNTLALRLLMDRIVTVSHDIRHTLSRQLDPEKLMTIHNGIDLESVRPKVSSREVRKRLRLEEHEFVIGSVGRLTPVKAYPLLLQAGRMLIETAPDVRLVLVGDGPERGMLERLAGELGIAAHVRFHGFTPEVAEIMTAFDVFVLSSLHEGISVSLLEALALGIPAVVTRVGGNPEIVIHGQTGLLVTPGDANGLADACELVRTDGELRARLSAAGRARVARDFTHLAMAERVASLYEQMRHCR